MTRILVVEDTPDQAEMIVALLEAEGYQVALARDGHEAVAAMNSHPCHLVLTDLQMPGMDGLELVVHLREHHPTVPSILMTAFGGEDIAAEALHSGAVSYIPKSRLADDLAELLEVQTDLVEAARDRQAALDHLARADLYFELPNDTSLIGPLVSFMDEALVARLGPDRDDVNLFQVGTALSESILNAVHHGNLEVDSKLREENVQEYLELAKRRSREAPYRKRKVFIKATIEPDSVSFRVEDEGSGFDVRLRPDPTANENLTQASGRGLYLISTFMDEVTHNAKGNVITMTKRFGEQAQAEAAR